MIGDAYPIEEGVITIKSLWREKPLGLGALSFVFAVLGVPAFAQLDRLAAAREMAESLATTTAIWGAPLVTMYDLRYNDAIGPRAPATPNSIWREADISTPEIAEKAGYVAPNVNTVYGFGFLDLEAEPIVLSVPDSGGRYYVVEIVDMWTNAFAYAGGVETGYKGGTFALVGPRWQGTVPSDMKRIDCPTRWVLVQPRVRVRGVSDLAGAEQVLGEITVRGLAEYQGQAGLGVTVNKYTYAAPHLRDPKLSVSALDFSDPLEFWDILSAAMNENPPPADECSALLPLFRPLGLELGKVWDRSKVNPVFLGAMRKAATDIGPMLAALQSQRGGGFQVPPLDVGNFGHDYLTRAFVARNGLTANTPKEAIYYLAAEDSSGHGLSGSSRYTVTFKTLPPVVKPGFWSVTLYDARTGYPVRNPVNRYSLGSDDDMKLAPNGSLTIFVQKESPGQAKESNWLPCGSGAFHLILRVYAPGEAVLKSLTDPSAYELPVIE